MDGHHRVSERVSSDHSDICRTYYIHCKRTDVLQCASVDVSSDYSYHTIPYHTHYMSTETPDGVRVSD